jgi:hypothetical protein
MYQIIEYKNDLFKGEERVLRSELFETSDQATIFALDNCERFSITMQGRLKNAN